MLHNNAMLKYIQYINKAVERLFLTIFKIQLTYGNKEFTRVLKSTHLRKLIKDKLQNMFYM